MKRWGVYVFVAILFVMAVQSCASSKHRAHKPCDCPNQSDNPRVTGTR